MNIGKASKASKVSAKMIRYYEQIGLTPPADRTDSGYRTYTEDDVHRLRFIGRARDLGFSVAEITTLLELWNDKSRQSADVKRLAQQHIDELEQRIESMLRMAETLQAQIQCCAGDEQSECSILRTLSSPMPQTISSKRVPAPCCDVRKPISGG
ncbi:Cu(I)-responsive transcriptional regulator [Pseudomonas paracarnis]|uniref:Cu(I)-responsive transcriptional regulator n=1 Tax=Pseudomonas paracarnis TaxID=2750625 RepID=UPI003917BF65